MGEDDMSEFGNRLRNLRISRGLSQASLGAQLERGESTVRMWELGKSNPDRTTLLKLSGILDVSLDILLGAETQLFPRENDDSQVRELFLDDDNPYILARRPTALLPGYREALESEIGAHIEDFLSATLHTQNAHKRHTRWRLSNGPDFAYARVQAYSVLLANRVRTYPVEVPTLKIENTLFISFVQFSYVTGSDMSRLTAEGTLTDGYTVKYRETNTVLYDPNARSSEGVNWTLAHEVGHIVLGHTKDDHIEEVEAHLFASELLAPMIILLELSRRRFELDVLSLGRLFGLSREAALKRLETLDREVNFRQSSGKSLQPINNTEEAVLQLSMSYINKIVPYKHMRTNDPQST